MTKLIVGLGNPGPEYEDTRHNAGFWLVDEVARRLKANLTLERTYFGLAARATTAAGPVWLLQPMTYMNLSGKSVGALARFFKIAPEDIVVAHDELDIPPGQVKVKQGGGHAGHNGLKDIAAQLGSPNFWRIRLGIGHPGDRAEVAAYVLRKPPVAEREAITASIQQALQGLELILNGDMQAAMMKIHAKPPRARSDASPRGQSGASSPQGSKAPQAPSLPPATPSPAHEQMAAGEEPTPPRRLP
jgi:PTH1 family peptidyl-tRNA hydrolase